MLRFTWFALLVVAALPADAFAQHGRSLNSTYALRQELGSDAYLIEPMLRRAAAEQAQQGSARPGSTRPGYGVRNAGHEITIPAPNEPRKTSPRPPRNVPGYYSQQRQVQPAQPRFIPGSNKYGATAKPFSSIRSQPTVTPYLNLFREEQIEDIPNYYTYVRPQLQQQQTNRQQHAELQRLQQQLQQTRLGSPAAPAGTTGMRQAARYGDTGQFYGGWNR